MTGLILLTRMWTHRSRCNSGNGLGLLAHIVPKWKHMTKMWICHLPQNSPPSYTYRWSARNLSRLTF